MQYFVPVDGFEENQIEIKPAGYLSNAKLLVNGQEAPKGSKRGEYLLQRNDGVEVKAKFKNMLFDPIPQVVINDEQVIKVVEPLKWYQWLWASLPILLIFMGGALGAFFGIIATNISIRIYRSEMGAIAQYLLIGLISIATGVIVTILAVLVSSLLR